MLRGDAAGVDKQPPEKTQDHEQRARKKPRAPFRFSAKSHVIQPSAVDHQAAVVTRPSDKSVTAGGVFDEAPVQALCLRHRFHPEFPGKNLLAGNVLGRGLIRMTQPYQKVH